MAFAPGDSSVVYAALADNNTGPRGIFKSVDGGASWKLTTTDAPRAFSIAVDPLDSKRVYAATDLGLYATADGGGKWAVTGPRTNLTAPILAFALGGDSSTLLVSDDAGRGLFRSRDRGATWQQVTRPPRPA